MRIYRRILIIIQSSLLIVFGSCVSVTGLSGDFTFNEVRTNYVLDLTDDGTLVTHKETNLWTLVPYGEPMYFKGNLKYSKDTAFILRNIRSHAEVYASWEYTSNLEVDYLRTGGYNKWYDYTAHEAMEKRFETPHQYPDRLEKVVVSYINSVEYDGIEGISHAFDPSWDLDQDGLIDDGVTGLPEYVDINIRNENWNTYVAKYWTESWYSIIEAQIDLVAAQHFDGIMLDVVNGFVDHISYELKNNPEMEYSDFLDIYKPLMDDLLTHIYNYSKEEYGTAFMVTGNLGWRDLVYYHDLGIMDYGSEQSAVFEGWGDGLIGGDGISTNPDFYENEARDLLVERGVQPINMEHLGKGEDNPYDWAKYEDEDAQKMSNFLYLLKWSIESGSTPYICPSIWTLYAYEDISDVDTLKAMKNQSLRPNRFPRFSRIQEALPPSTNTIHNDWVIGSDNDDVFSTGDGDDLVYTGRGNDEVDLGDGIDGTYYLEPKENYEIEINEIETVITHRDSTKIDRFTSLEYILFEDDVVDLTSNTIYNWFIYAGVGSLVVLTGIIVYIRKFKQ